MILRAKQRKRYVLSKKFLDMKHNLTYYKLRKALLLERKKVRK
nr:MAG TPA_asm: hypothetical protein [Caudoviricetes sp.]